jgi:RNA polymerase sigma-70 factor, ECF subfamily
VQIDPQILRDAQAGQVDAFNQLVVAYRRRVIRTLARIIGRPEKAEDVAQEVFTRVYFGLAQLRETATFDTWLHRITVHAAYDYLRGPRGSRSRREARMADVSELQVMLADAAAGAQAHVEERRRQAIRDVVAQLLAAVPEADRILLALRELEGMSIEELAQVYQIGQSAVKVRLFRARQRAVKALQATSVVRPRSRHATSASHPDGQMVPC